MSKFLKKLKQNQGQPVELPKVPTAVSAPPQEPEPKQPTKLAIPTYGELNTQFGDSVPEDVLQTFIKNLERLKSNAPERDLANALVKVGDTIKQYPRLAEVYAHDRESRLAVINIQRNMSAVTWQGIQDNITGKQLMSNAMADILGDFNV